MTLGRTWSGSKILGLDTFVPLSLLTEKRPSEYEAGGYDGGKLVQSVEKGPTHWRHPRFVGVSDSNTGALTPTLQWYGSDGFSQSHFIGTSNGETVSVAPNPGYPFRSSG